MYPTARRTDYFCIECRAIFSVYINEMPTKSKRKNMFCPHCGECADTQRYSPAKHGGVSGRYQPWTTKEQEKLKKLLKKPLSWAQIAEEMGPERGRDAVRGYAERMGWVKEYIMTPGRKSK